MATTKNSTETPPRPTAELTLAELRQGLDRIAAARAAARSRPAPPATRRAHIAALRAALAERGRSALPGGAAAVCAAGFRPPDALPFFDTPPTWGDLAVLVPELFATRLESLADDAAADRGAPLDDAERAALAADLDAQAEALYVQAEAVFRDADAAGRDASRWPDLPPPIVLGDPPDVARFLALEERAAQLRAAARDVTDRRREARQTVAHLESEIARARPALEREREPVPPTLAAPLAAAREQHERLGPEVERLAARAGTAGALVDACRRHLRERGVDPDVAGRPYPAHGLGAPMPS